MMSIYKPGEAAKIQRHEKLMRRKPRPEPMPLSGVGHAVEPTGYQYALDTTMGCLSLTKV